MRTTADNRQQAFSGFFVHFGHERPHERFPLRQSWRLLCGSLSSLAPAVLRNAEGNRSRFAIIRGEKDGEILVLHAQRNGRYVCLRSEARLSSLLGFEDQVDRLSAGAAEVAVWLARHEPRSPTPALPQPGSQ